MRAPAIDPEARAFLSALPIDEQQVIHRDLCDLEAFSVEPTFVEEFGIPVPGALDVFVTRVGRGGRWWAYWRRMPTDPPPIRHLHVLLIEDAPLPPKL